LRFNPLIFDIAGTNRLKKGEDNYMPLYKVKAKVLIEIETEFDDDIEPTPDTIKFCVDEDIAEEMSIEGAVNDCKVVEFFVEEISDD